jgi:hypothetical protein
MTFAGMRQITNSSVETRPDLSSLGIGLRDIVLGPPSMADRIDHGRGVT